VNRSRRNCHCGRGRNKSPSERTKSSRATLHEGNSLLFAGAPNASRHPASLSCLTARGGDHFGPLKQKSEIVRAFRTKGYPPRPRLIPSTPTPPRQCAGNTALQGLRPNRNASVTASTPRSERSSEVLLFQHIAALLQTASVWFFSVGLFPALDTAKRLPGLRAARFVGPESDFGLG